jgi:hypothetical protein
MSAYDGLESHSALMARLGLKKILLKALTMHSDFPKLAYRPAKYLPRRDYKRYFMISEVEAWLAAHDLNAELEHAWSLYRARWERAENPQHEADRQELAALFIQFNSGRLHRSAINPIFTNEDRHD